MSERPETIERINVAVTPLVAQTLVEIVDDEGLTLADAVNELIQCGKLVRAALRATGRVFIRHEDGRSEELILLNHGWRSG